MRVLVLLALLVGCGADITEITIVGRDFDGDGSVVGTARRGFSSIFAPFDTGACEAFSVHLDATSPGGDGVDLFIDANNGPVLLDIEGATSPTTCDFSVPFQGHGLIHVRQRDHEAATELLSVRVMLVCD